MSTKFNINDTVYILVANKIQKGIIYSLRALDSLDESASVYYIVKINSNKYNYAECDVFSTPEELSNHLLKTAVI